MKVVPNDNFKFGGERVKHQNRAVGGNATNTRYRNKHDAPPTLSNISAYRGMLCCGATIGRHTRWSHDVRQQIINGPQSRFTVHRSASGGFGQGFELRKSTGQAAGE